MTIEPGGQVTFSGSSSDDEGLKNVEISFRNSSTGENLGSDCTWGIGISAGNCRISPVNISGSVYNWTWTSPSNLPAGSYSFTVRATDDEDHTTSSTNQGRLSLSAQYPGDGPPNTTMAFVAPTDGSLTVNLAGTATDETGVTNVRVSLQERETGRYLQANGTLGASQASARPRSARRTATTHHLVVAADHPAGWWRLAVLGDGLRRRGQFRTRARPRRRATTYPGDGLPTSVRHARAAGQRYDLRRRARSSSPAAPRTPRTSTPASPRCRSAWSTRRAST